jgi:DNA/RNA-binding domain of Phe-tRNA-synthetase-like protein
MLFKIDPRIFQRFPGLIIGAIAVKCADNSGTAEAIQSSLRSQETRIKSEFQLPTLSQHPKIDVWRKAYSAFGGKPDKNKSSVESLYRLVLQGAELRHINSLVDIYNFVSLKHMLPAGGEDLGKIKGDVLLTFAGAGEPAVLLLGEKELRPPHAGEVIYKDDVSAICRRWNWREADRTKLTEETKNCILVIEGLPPITREEVENATRELSELVQKFCGAEASYKLLDAQSPECDIGPI